LKKRGKDHYRPNQKVVSDAGGKRENFLNLNTTYKLRIRTKGRKVGKRGGRTGGSGENARWDFSTRGRRRRYIDFAHN